MKRTVISYKVRPETAAVNEQRYVTGLGRAAHDSQAG